MNKKDNLYIAYCCIMSIVFFMRYFELSETINNLLMLVTAIAIGLFFLYWINVKFTKKELLKQIIILGIATAAYFLSGCEYEYIILTVLAVVGSKNIEIKKITKYMFITLLVVFIIYMLGIILNIIPNTTYVKTDKFGNNYTTYTFGGHGNAFFCIWFTLIILYIYSFFEKIRFIHIVILEIISLVFYFLTYSRTGIVIVSILLIATAVLKILGNKIDKIKFIPKFIKLLTIIIIPLMFITVYVLSTKLYGGELYSTVNNLITARLEVANYYISNFGVELLPQDYDVTVTFDNLYAFIMVTFGWGITILICSIYIKLIRQLCKEKKYLEILIIMVFVLYSFSEKMFINVFRNFSILFFQYTLFRKEKEVEK